MRFESKRLLFESRITDLCLGCEQFWTELINKQMGNTQKEKRQQEYDFRVNQYQQEQSN